MAELKAGASEELVQRADKAWKISDEYNSRADLIRDAVGDRADEILETVLKGDDSDAVEETDAEQNTASETDDEKFQNLDVFWNTHGDDENLQTLTADDVPDDFSFGNYDLNDTDTLTQWYHYRLGALRAWLVEHHGATVRAHTVRAILQEEFEITEPTMYDDLRRIPKYGVAYPMLEADPRWDDEELRQRLLDHLATKKSSIGTSREERRDELASKYPSLKDLLEDKVIKLEDGSTVQVYPTKTKFFLRRNEYELWLDRVLARMEQAVYQDNNVSESEKFAIVYDAVLEYLIEDVEMCVEDAEERREKLDAWMEDS